MLMDSRACLQQLPMLCTTLALLAQYQSLAPPASAEAAAAAAAAKAADVRASVARMSVIECAPPMNIVWCGWNMIPAFAAAVQKARMRPRSCSQGGEGKLISCVRSSLCTGRTGGQERVRTSLERLAALAAEGEEWHLRWARLTKVLAEPCRHGLRREALSQRLPAALRRDGRRRGQWDRGEGGREGHGVGPERACGDDARGTCAPRLCAHYGGKGLAVGNTLA